LYITSPAPPRRLLRRGGGGGRACLLHGGAGAAGGPKELGLDAPPPLIARLGLLFRRRLAVERPCVRITRRGDIGFPAEVRHSRGGVEIDPRAFGVGGQDVAAHLAGHATKRAEFQTSSTRGKIRAFPAIGEVTELGLEPGERFGCCGVGHVGFLSVVRNSEKWTARRHGSMHHPAAYSRRLRADLGLRS